MSRSSLTGSLLLAVALLSQPGCKKHPAMDIPFSPNVTYIELWQYVPAVK
jgi:hypothetical protein